MLFRPESEKRLREALERAKEHQRRNAESTEETPKPRRRQRGRVKGSSRRTRGGKVDPEAIKRKRERARERRARQKANRRKAELAAQRQAERGIVEEDKIRTPTENNRFKIPKVQRMKNASMILKNRKPFGFY